MRKWNLCAIMILVALLAVACGEEGGGGIVGDTCTTENEMQCDGTVVVKCTSGAWADMGDCADYGMVCVEVNNQAGCTNAGTDTDIVTDNGVTDTDTPVTDTPVTDTDATGNCGNGITDTGEVCDGGAKNCTELGFASGWATCKTDCTGWDTAGCTGGTDTDTIPDADTDNGGDATCQEINQCLVDNNCADQACWDACLATGSQAEQDKLNALYTCLDTNCATQCDGSDETACSECIGANCSDQYDACFPPIDVPAYGTLNANSTAFNYIYDGDGDLNAQIQANQSGLVLANVFTGTYGTTNKPIPGTGATQTLALAIHQAASGGNPAILAVMQQSQTSSAVVNPIVQLMFPSDAISPGQFDMDPTKEGGAVLVLLNAIGTSDSCLLAYCFSGATNVTAANNTTAASGGSITMGVVNAKVYHPTETPIGDISGQFTGVTICVKE